MEPDSMTWNAALERFGGICALHDRAESKTCIMPGARIAACLI